MDAHPSLVSDLHALCIDTSASPTAVIELQVFNQLLQETIAPYHRHDDHHHNHQPLLTRRQLVAANFLNVRLLGFLLDYPGTESDRVELFVGLATEIRRLRRAIDLDDGTEDGKIPKWRSRWNLTAEEDGDEEENQDQDQDQDQDQEMMPLGLAEDELETGERELEPRDYIVDFADEEVESTMDDDDY